MASLDIGGIRFRLAPDVDPGPAEPRLRRAVEILASGSAANEKTGRRKQLYRLDLGGDGAPDHLVKVTRYAAADGWRRRIAGSKAHRELERAKEVAARGIATPLPMAAGEEISGGRLRACYLVVPIVPGARDLRRVWREQEGWREQAGGREDAAGSSRAAERRALETAFGAFSRAVHDAGVFQDDFAPNNFLLGSAGPDDLWMIDFERAVLRSHVGPDERRFMLAKLDRELAGARLTQRARFLRAYCDGDRGAWRTLWRDLEGEAARLAARDAARLLRVTTRSGRRFGPFEQGGWTGFRHGEAPQKLAEALDAVAAAPVRAALEPCSLRATASHFGLDLSGLDPREGRRLWARAHLLARRGGLGPAPLALAWRGPRAVLLFAGALPPLLTGLDPEDSERALPALTVFLDRLHSLGTFQPAPPPGLVSWETPDRPSLLWAGGLQLAGRGTPERHAASRRLARHLLGLEA